MRTWVPLNPPLPLETSKGFGYAHFVIDHGFEHNLQWQVWINEGPNVGQSWIIDNSEVRVCTNWSLKRPQADPITRR